MSQALFSPSDFLAAANTSVLPVSYTADTSFTTAEAPDSPKFSEYLAALDETAGNESTTVIQDETAAAAETSSGTDDEETSVSEESAAGESYLTLPETGGGGGAARETVAEAADEQAALNAVFDGAAAAENLAVARDVLNNEAAEAPVLHLAEASTRTGGDDKAARQALDAAGAGGEAGTAKEIPENAEKNSAANLPKAIPASGHEKTENTPKDAGGTKTLNAGDGIYIDEKTPEIKERLAGSEPRGAVSVDENTPFHAKTPAAGKESTEDAVLIHEGGAELIARAAAPQATEKNSASNSSGEKKSLSEKTKRNAAAERIEAGGGAVSGGTARLADAVEPRRVNAAPEAEITVNIRGEARSAPAGEGVGGAGGAAAKPSALFENFLARELQQNLNGDIVKQAQVLLREGGEGTIRLSLKPESLGKVKISLEMTENKITGKIVVESGEALRAFEREMDALEQTFRSEGFDGASLSLELSGHEEPRGGEAEWRTDGGRLSVKTASARYDETSGGGVYFGAAQSAKQINVLV
ncbi:MAG: flagellar hook-length control protein FliK [Spirochaetaceae bacterium]|nr:flagellar hook-length control protein FliK [Spirochaetaceae bacterium]